MSVRSYDPARVLRLALVPICFYLILSPVWAPGSSFRLFDNARCLQLGLLALVAVQLLFPPAADAVVSAWLALGHVPRVLILIFLFGGTLSAFNSGAPHLGALEVALVAQLVILFLFVDSAVRLGKADAEPVLALAACAGAALFLLQFWVTYVLYALEGKTFPWLSPFLEFANIRFFSEVQAYTLFLVALPLTLLPLGKPWRILVYVVAVNYWALQWIIGGRAVWVGFAAAVVAVLAFMKQGRVAWLRQQVVMVSAGALIYLAFSYAVALSSGPGAVPVPGVKEMVKREDSLIERVELVKTSAQFISQRPLLGVGPGQFGLQTYPMNVAHPHDVPLQLLSEYGVPAGVAGIALGVLLLIYALRTLRGGSSRAPDAVTTGLVAALIMGLTDSLFSGNLIMPHSQILFCVVAGWLLGRTQSWQSESNPGMRGRPLLRVALPSGALLAVAVTTILGFEYLTLVSDLPASLPRWNPHFWLYGRFDAW